MTTINDYLAMSHTDKTHLVAYHLLGIDEYKVQRLFTRVLNKLSKTGKIVQIKTSNIPGIFQAVCFTPIDDGRTYPVSVYEHEDFKEALYIAALRDIKVLFED